MSSPLLRHGAARYASHCEVAFLTTIHDATEIHERVCLGLALGFLTACGPHAHIPLRPANLPDALAPTDSGALLARRLAPVLYLQPDETFPLERVVAVLHPFRRVIAYHLLWRDDVHGSWIPFTIPTDEEVLWVGYDSTYAPTDVWTYRHGKILDTGWPRSQVAIDVQWGKHGSLPRNVRQSDLPRPCTLALDKKIRRDNSRRIFSILSFQSAPIYLLASRGGTCSRLLSLSDEEEVLLRGALFENLQCVHQLIVVRDTAPLGRRVTECQPRDGVAKQSVDL